MMERYRNYTTPGLLDAPGMAMEPRTLDELVPAIRRELGSEQAAARATLQHALNAGALLLEAKKLVRHGNWQGWVRTSCDVSERTAQVHMKLARELPRLLDRQNRSVADMSLREALALLAAPGEAIALLAAPDGPMVDGMGANVEEEGHQEHEDVTPPEVQAVQVTPPPTVEVVETVQAPALAPESWEPMTPTVQTPGPMLETPALEGEVMHAADETARDLIAGIAGSQRDPAALLLARVLGAFESLANAYTAKQVAADLATANVAYYSDAARRLADYATALDVALDVACGRL
jgi:hypothetical protein